MVDFSNFLNIRILLSVAYIFLAGCSAYPLNMTEQEWNALTPKQQDVARQKQRDAYRFNADEVRCQRVSARKVAVRIPTGGLFYPVGFSDHEIHLGNDWEFYRKCMELAGWDMPVIIDIVK